MNDAFMPPQLLWLLLLWAIFLFGGFILGPTRNNRRIPRWARLASSLLLVIAAWTWRAFASDAWHQTYTTLIALGVTAGFIGDLFMADVLARSKSKSVAGGIGGFALGHLFYISAILLTARTLHLTHAAIIGGSLMFFWLFAFWGWRKIVMRGGAPTPLHWAALPYSLLLAATAGLALGLSLQQCDFWPLALGATLFLLSDLLLASALFGKSAMPLLHDFVWLLYGPGQMLIVYSAMLLH
jgi:hypothetical protein